jgi:polysaccharide export outer membrane protein
VKAGGISVEQLQKDLLVKLKTYVRNPQIVITVTQFRSEPLFLVGAFKTPGIYTLQGQRTLVEILTSIGGLQPNASRRVKVTRKNEYGRIPLSKTVDDPDGGSNSAEINIGSLRDNIAPAEDIVLKPYDVLSVERAEMVYINGEVGKVGGFEINERESMSVTQLITLAGGWGKDADPAKAKVLRPVLNTSRRAEIPLDLKRVLDGKANDFPLLPNDVLYVPRVSGMSKKNVGRTLLIAIPTATALSYLIVSVTR